MRRAVTGMHFFNSFDFDELVIELDAEFKENRLKICSEHIIKVK